MSDGPRSRRPMTYVPLPNEGGWLALLDDDLLHRIHSLEPDHSNDDDLMAIVCSDRHFYVRQEAAKRVRETDRLKEFAADRHVGQILVRQMGREGDVAYLEQIVRESRYVEVRRAAQAQLKALRPEK